MPVHRVPGRVRSPPANQLTSPCRISPTKASSGGRTQSSSPASRSQKRPRTVEALDAEPPAGLQPLFQTAFDEPVTGENGTAGPRASTPAGACAGSCPDFGPPGHVVRNRALPNVTGPPLARSAHPGGRLRSGAWRRASRLSPPWAPAGSPHTGDAAGAAAGALSPSARLRPGAWSAESRGAPASPKAPCGRCPAGGRSPVSDMWPWCSSTKRRKYSVSAPDPPASSPSRTGGDHQARAIDGRRSGVSWPPSLRMTARSMAFSARSMFRRGARSGLPGLGGQLRRRLFSRRQVFRGGSASSSVGPACPERRAADRHHPEPGVEVVAELASVRLRRGRDGSAMSHTLTRRLPVAPTRRTSPS